MRTLQRALGRVRRLWTGSLPRRLVLGITLLFAAMSSAFILDLSVRQRDFLYQRAETRGMALAQTLAVTGVSWLLSSDVAGLEEVVDSLERYPDLRYAMVLDRAGKVLAHTDRNHVGFYVHDPVSNRLLTAPPQTQILVNDAGLIDVAAPIMANGKLVGWARIGVDRGSVNAMIQVLTRNAVLFALAGIALAALFALGVARGLTRDLARLATLTREISRGRGGVRCELPREDELGTLSLAFDAMAVDLELARAELRRTNRELERRVIERTGQLEAANKDLEGFSYSVSHDLRAPLRAIDGFSNILLEDYADKIDAEGRRLLVVVRNNTEKMARLIDDILAFSRVGRRDLTLAENDMEALVRAVFAELMPEGRTVNLRLAPLPSACADPAMIRQVWVNLLSNAVKFTRPREVAEIEVSGQGGNNEGVDELVYRVKDNGVGFDPRYLDKLFGVFQRLHGAEEFDGTGIGLAIVKRIIDKHGGRVWAESQPGAGASFHFALPRRERCEAGGESQ